MSPVPPAGQAATKKLLLIGATDPNGAGLQADWRVCAQLGVVACSVVTAVTAQTHQGVSNTGILPPEQLQAQLQCIDWQQVDAIKIGMLGNSEVVRTLLPFLDHGIPLVIDPVLVASSGGRLLDKIGQRLLIEELVPRAGLITPNLGEARALTGINDETSSAESLASGLRDLGAGAVLVTGASEDIPAGTVSDFFASDEHHAWLSGRYWPDRDNVRGTGCSLATAIASALVRGQPMSEAVVLGKASINAAIGQARQDGEAWQLRGIDWPRQESHLPRWRTTLDTEVNRMGFPDCGSRRLGIYPVVESVDWIRRLVPLGVETIQLRVKSGTAEEIDAQVARAVDYCRRYPVRLFINDHWQAAIRHGAYGVHLGQEDLAEADLDQIRAAGLRLGISTHCYREVACALAVKPSYLALGPIYPTTSKQMPWIPQGVEAVRSWVSMLDPARPLVAIGGIDTSRARDLATTGVGSVAMISAITQANDPEMTTRELLEIWQN